MLLESAISGGQIDFRVFISRRPEEKRTVRDFRLPTVTASLSIMRSDIWLLYLRPSENLHPDPISIYFARHVWFTESEMRAA